MTTMTDTNTADTTAALFAAIDSGNEDCVKQDPVEAAKWRDRAEKARAAEYRIDEMQGNRR